MGSVILIIGLLLLATFIFVVWLCCRIVVTIGRALVGATKPPMPVATASAGDWATCRNNACRSVNAKHASFCRQCGAPIVAGNSAMRYVA